MLSSRKELTSDARELKGELYCLPCHDKMGIPICGACRRPIEGRVVNALGKQWHVEVSLERAQIQAWFTVPLNPTLGRAPEVRIESLSLGAASLVLAGNSTEARRPEPTRHAQAAHSPYLLALFAFWKILESVSKSKPWTQSLQSTLWGCA